jgi:hypothetical protein
MEDKEYIKILEGKLALQEQNYHKLLRYFCNIIQHYGGEIRIPQREMIDVRDVINYGVDCYFEESSSMYVIKAKELPKHGHR